QFLSDLQRQDIDWPKSNDLYNEYDNTYSPIDKLLNHLLEATVLKGTHSKKEQTSEQKHRVNPSQPTYTTSNFRVHPEHQQESEIQVPSTNEKSIVSYYMMRCLICYRKFKIDVATKHVETCTRKGNGTNSLGSTTATGYSPISFRARQYAEDLQKRTLHKPTLTPNNQSKNEVLRKKSETEIRM
ncbi:uncharacterized protein DC041_0007756, partial [Schistosoma bovis]